MKWSAFFAVLFLFIIGCKSNEAESSTDASGFFPVRSYLQSQVREVNTDSIWKVVKITKAHGTVDTTSLQGKDFTVAAQDFLSLPDIGSPALRKKYTETKLYDADLKKVVITYQLKDKGDYEQITRQDVLIEPGTSGSNDQVATIYIETAESDGDSSIQKKMTWNTLNGSIGGDFQIITLIHKQGQPEQVQTTEVHWMSGP